MKKIPVDNLLFNIYKLTGKNKFGPGDLFKIRMELENNLPDTYFDVTRDSIYKQSMIYGQDIMDYDYESRVVSVGNISDYMIKNSNDAECISGEFYEDYKKVLINVINTLGLVMLYKEEKDPSESSVVSINVNVDKNRNTQYTFKKPWEDSNE